MDRRRGCYLGTEIDEKWWKRYAREGLFVRGNGEYWFDDEISQRVSFPISVVAVDLALLLLRICRPYCTR